MSQSIGNEQGADSQFVIGFLWVYHKLGSVTNHEQPGTGGSPWEPPTSVHQAEELFCRDCWRQYLEQAVSDGRGRGRMVRDDGWLMTNDGQWWCWLVLVHVG